MVSGAVVVEADLVKEVVEADLDAEVVDRKDKVAEAKVGAMAVEEEDIM